MTDPTRRVAITTWHGAYVADGDRIVAEYPFPSDPQELAARRRLRSAGALAPEEEKLLSDATPGTIESHDRRLVAAGARATAGRVRAVALPSSVPSNVELRRLLLDDGARGLAESWDPSVYVEEAVRATGDLDRAINLLGERLASWAGRDTVLPSGDDSAVDDSVAAELAGSDWTPIAELPPVDPALADARRALARLVLDARATRRKLEAAVAGALPERAPNLSALLGPALAARLISQAGGLERLARLPSSTVQVLGAEKAFFEHLRGRAPPPRHGLLFVHGSIQSAPRALRGRLARALAGKAAIAARIDLAKGAVDPSLRESFERRATAIRSAGPGKTAKGRAPRRLRPPLDGTAED